MPYTSPPPPEPPPRPHAQPHEHAQPEGPLQNVSPSPVVGTETLLVLLVVLVLQVGLPQLESFENVLHAVWLGSMWGGLSVATWLLAGGRQSLWGLGLLLAVAVWHISWMQHVSGQPLSRYVLSMGGLVVAQALSMLVTNSPPWRWPGFGKPARTAPRPRQFNIAGLLVLTLMCAASFAAARHYQSDDQLFYPGIAVAIVTLVVITLFAQRLAASSRRSWCWAAGLLGALVAGVSALSTLAAVNDQLRNQPSSVQTIEHTEVILGVFAAIVWTAVFSGRGRKVEG